MEAHRQILSEIGVKKEKGMIALLREVIEEGMKNYRS